MAIKGWVDSEYLAGRTTGISDAEMLEQVRKNLPELAAKTASA